jgi:septum formation protein
MSARLSLWRGDAPLLLASTSPTRRMLLESAGLIVDVQASDVDERAVEAAGAHDGPPALALRLAREKALAVSRRRPDRLVVGADQTLACKGKMFHKPLDRAEAGEQLAALSGRTHVLHSAFALAQGGAVLHHGIEGAHMTMRDLDTDAIELYLDAAGEAPMQSVGAYQVEGLGIHLFERIEGDHSTILGLPMLPLLAALREEGLLAC